MKTLYLLRHAKAERESTSGEDFDRPLMNRGRDNAAALGRTFNAKARPDLILASPSKRTMETVEFLSAGWAKCPPIETDDKLYLAPAPRLLDAVRCLPDSADSAMLVGHNPGMEELAIQFANKVPSDMLRRMQRKFPTCAMATFAISVEGWPRATAELSRLTAFSTPKDLAAN